MVGEVSEDQLDDKAQHSRVLATGPAAKFSIPCRSSISCRGHANCAPLAEPAGARTAGAQRATRWEVKPWRSR